MLGAQLAAVEDRVWSVDDLAAADEASSWAGACGVQGQRRGFTGAEEKRRLRAEEDCKDDIDKKTELLAFL